MTMSSPEGLSFTVQYIGFVTVKPSGIGPGIVQKPLTELYLTYRKTSTKVQERHLTITDRGLSIDGPGMTKEEQYSIPDIPFWHAVQFVTVKAKRDKYKGAFEPLDQEVLMNFENMYFDIEKKMNFITKLEHPAIFAVVLRRKSGLRALDCHAYMCDTQDDAKGVAKALSRIAKDFKDAAPGVFDYNPWSAPLGKVSPKAKANQIDAVHGRDERGSSESHNELPGMRHASEGSSSTPHGTSPMNLQGRLRMASDPLPNTTDHHSPVSHPISGAAALLMNAQLGPSNNASETRRGVPIGVTYPFPVTGGRGDNSLQLDGIESNNWENDHQFSNGMSNKNTNHDIITRNLEPKLQPEGKNNVYVNFPVSNDLNSEKRRINTQGLPNQGFLSAGGEDQSINLGQGYSFMGVAPHEPGYEDDGTTTPQHGSRPQPIGDLPDHRYVNGGPNKKGLKSPGPSNDNDFSSGGMLARNAKQELPFKEQHRALGPTSPRFSQIQDNNAHGHFQLQPRTSSEHYIGASPSTNGVYTPISNNPSIANVPGHSQVPYTPAMTGPTGQTGYSPRAPGEHRAFIANSRPDSNPIGYGPSGFIQGMVRTPIMPHFTPGPTRPSGKPFYKVQMSAEPPPSPVTDYWNQGRNRETSNFMAQSQPSGMQSYDSQYSSPTYETSLYQEIPESSTGGYLKHKTPHESRIHEDSVKEKEINYEPFTDHMRVLESQRQQERPIAKVTPHKIGGIRVLPKLPLAEVNTNPDPVFLNRKDPKRRSRSKSPARQVPVNELHSKISSTQVDEEMYFKNDMKKQTKQNKLAPKTSKIKYESNWQFGQKKKEGNYSNQYHENKSEDVSMIDKSVGERLLLNKKKDAEIASAISHLNVESNYRFGSGLEESLGYLP